MDGEAVVANDVLARYAADAAREVEGVADIADGPLHRGKGVEISGEGGPVGVEIHVELEWGRNAPQVGREVQRRVAEYLERMADVTLASIAVVVDGVGAPPAKRS